MSAILFTACGEDDESEFAPHVYDYSFTTISEFEDVHCNRKREGREAFIEDDKVSYVCVYDESDTVYIWASENDTLTADGENFIRGKSSSSSDEEDKSSCSSEEDKSSSSRSSKSKSSSSHSSDKSSSSKQSSSSKASSKSSSSSVASSKSSSSVGSSSSTPASSSATSSSVESSSAVSSSSEASSENAKSSSSIKSSSSVSTSSSVSSSSISSNSESSSSSSLSSSSIIPASSSAISSSSIESSSSVSSSSEVVSNIVTPRILPPKNYEDMEPILKTAGEQFNPDFEYGYMYDNRDETIYRTTTIHGVTWMAENLKYRGNTVGESFCFNEENRFCKLYGRLYSRDAAMNDSRCAFHGPCNLGEDPIQGICPQGWHIPTVAEVNDLVALVDGNAMPLMSPQGWKSYFVGGTDEYGFSFVGSGFFGETKWTFQDHGLNTTLWVYNNASRQNYLLLQGPQKKIFLHNYDYDEVWVPVRCVKNY
ncbi:MAG: hypothetical protein J6U20_12675 [Fibrobacter sp.]|nr:hypothetical protein [Fibrobacter sp.]